MRSSSRDFFVVAGFATVTRENVCFSLLADSFTFSLARISSSCHTELSPRPRNFRSASLGCHLVRDVEVSNHVSSLRVSSTRGLQRHHLVLQRVSDARARPGLPYLFRSFGITRGLRLMIHVREFPPSMRPFSNRPHLFRNGVDPFASWVSSRDFSRNESRARSKRATPSAASSAGLLAKPSRRFFIPFLFGLLARESGDVEQLQARRPVR